MKKILFILIILVISIKPVNAKYYWSSINNNLKYRYINGGIKVEGKLRKVYDKETKNIVYSSKPYMSGALTSPCKESKETYILNDFQKDKIKKIIYFGYQYKNHTDEIWYYITQIMVWRSIIPTLNLTFYNEELEDYVENLDSFLPYFDEINELISKYENNEIIIEEKLNINIDEYAVYKLNGFTLAEDKYAKIEDNKVIFNTSTPFKQKYLLTNSEYNELKIYKIIQDKYEFYIEKNDVELDKKILNVSLEAAKVKININRDNLEKEYAEEMILGIYDLNDKNIKTISTKDIEENQDIYIPYGKYIIKEIETNKYIKNIEEINLNVEKNNEENNITISLEENKKDIEIDFNYNDEIEFKLYNDNFLNSYKTDTAGKAKVNLYIDKYTIEQVTTLEGYEPVKENLDLKTDDKFFINIKKIPEKVENILEKEEIIIPEKILDNNIKEEIINNPNTYKDPNINLLILIIINCVFMQILIKYARKL